VPQAFLGIRVVDFTQVLAGPFATQQLAMLGADVIKIEEPSVGDQTRAMGTGATTSSMQAPGMTPTFMSCNTGKRSLTLNLKHEYARDVVLRLVKSADVVVENFRPGVMARLGFDYDTCVALNPDLIYCSISGYGQLGPKSGIAAYDGAVQADSGMMAITGTPDSGPLRTGYMPVDMSTALNAAFAISAALYRRGATGLGQRLDVAMIDTAVVMQTAQFARYLDSGEMPERIGNRSPTGQPTANVFSTSDSFLQVLALRQNQVEKLFGALDISDKLAQPQFVSSDARVEHYDVVSACVSERMLSNTTEHWYQALLDAGVPVARIRDFSEVRADPQFAQRNVFIDVPNPSGEGTNTVIGTGYIADSDGPKAGRVAPGLGEHTHDVLSELGFGTNEIEKFRAAGAL
jgi:CoA:oxalate CoA-transferase